MTPAHPEDAAEAKAPTPPPLPPRKKRDRDADSGKEDQASTDATAAPKKARASDDAGEADAPKSPSFASFVAHKDTQKADADAQDAAVQADTEKVQDTATTSSTDEVPATVPAPVAATANEVAPERPPEASGDAPGKSGSSARTSVPVSTAAGAVPTDPSQTTEPVGVAETAAPQKSGPSLGFGAFAARSAPFKSATALSDKAKAGKDDATNWTKAESSESAPTLPDAEDIVVRKRAIQKPDAELTTGEEEEETVAATRAKLYTMAKDHSWKERGTGVLKLNRKAGGDATSARLVMRSDAVLRVILNVKLFAGMQCHVEQERFLRIVAMEQDGLVHFALKLANAHEAESFLAELQQNIPAQPGAAAK
ncbi:hypothetical protein CBS14141_004245 [Malassezia furfur]|nr:hypothetical protein CBS14141_004245 [Malassezia furfur]